MKLTKHAQKRKSQRGFSDFSLEIINKFGCCERAPGGALKISFGKKESQRLIEELKKIIQSLDRVKGRRIIEKNGYVLTLYKY